MSNVFSGLQIFKGLLHTFVRTIPLGLYFFTYFSLTLYEDLRSGVLLLGVILNDIFGYIYKKYTKTVYNDACAMFGSAKPGGNLAFLNNTHIEIIAFLASFFFSEMWMQDKMDWFKFNFLTFMIVITIWSRMAINCEIEIQGVIFNLLFGFMRGGLFFYFFSDMYKEAMKGKLESESCNLGYSNYKCETIKDGVVIVKHPFEDQNKKSEEDGAEENTSQ
jgi:hypothetical protein